MEKASDKVGRYDRAGEFLPLAPCVNALPEALIEPTGTRKCWTWKETVKPWDDRNLGQIR